MGPPSKELTLFIILFSTICIILLLAGIFWSFLAARKSSAAEKKRRQQQQQQQSSSRLRTFYLNTNNTQNQNRDIDIDIERLAQASPSIPLRFNFVPSSRGQSQPVFPQPAQVRGVSSSSSRVPARPRQPLAINANELEEIDLGLPYNHNKSKKGGWW